MFNFCGQLYLMGSFGGEMVRKGDFELYRVYHLVLHRLG